MALVLLLLALATPLQDDAPPPFREWLDAFVAEARTRGFDDALLDAALGDLEPLERVVASDRTQAELTPGFERYYASRVNDAVVRRGRALAGEHRALLDRIEARFGVPRRFVLAIWAIETRYGRNMGRTPVFQALATLAWEPRRAAFFRGQLFDALTMAATEDIPTGVMVGSWAGAMGHGQFMPSSYLEYAVDFDGDGRRDIWRSTPDALASIANYLARHGWDDTFTWGREVRLGPGAEDRVGEVVPQRTEGCYAMRTMTSRVPLPEWHTLGVRQVNGSRLPGANVPAGLARTDSRAFLAYPNYDVLLRYNCAHYYALTVALLSDRLR
ncbi:MAG: lytic murein transglycosylase, partial [Acidobacteria bacterium]|nr:lytic murein transglycosylase [Acidobacteriota bacterium]